MTNNNEYKTCDKCCYDILDDEGDVMDHECISDNEMIAEFMGKEIYQKHHESNYHCSWDWLMPVTEKCLTTDEPSDGQHYFINDALLTCNIEVVYDRVVEFIKEYNDGQG